MATTYRAPGVYVEEIPSARQPIAGVGTNTAGFIGIVPDTIYYPVPNPDYDPVVAEAAMRLQTLPADSPERAAEEETLRRNLETHRARLAELAPQLTAAQSDLETKNAAVTTAKKEADDLGKLRGADREAKREDIAKAQAQSRAASAAAGEASDRLAALKEESDRHEAAIRALEQQPSGRAGGGGGAATGGGGGGEQPAPGGGQGGGDRLKDDDRVLLTPSPLRPYYLKEFKLPTAPLDTKLCTNFREYSDRFGGFSAYHNVARNPNERNPARWQFEPIDPGHHALTHAVNGFFQNGGTRCFVARITGPEQLGAALEAFQSIDELALLAVPGVLPMTKGVWSETVTFANNQENCFAILDCPRDVPEGAGDDLEIRLLSYDHPDNALPPATKDAAYYFPYIEVIDSAKQLQDGDLSRQIAPKYRGRTYVPPSGHVAGIYARTDEERGVHKAPANAVVRGAVDLRYYISKPKQELLNPQGVNCIRNMSGNIAVWGARTIGGDRNGEWKYVPVRRLFLYLRESIDEGTQWVVFEPNDRALWGKIILNVSAFLTNVWRSGALFGNTPEEAFYVKCDDELNPPEVRDLGQVVTEIGVSIVRPAEFVIFRITQETGRQTA